MNSEHKRFSAAAMHSLLQHLLPDGADLCCTDLTFTDQAITLTLHSTAPTCPCPTCQQPSSQVRSRYMRTLVDLPWGSCPVRYHLTVRRFRCRNAACERHIFAERLPAVTRPAARRTTRARDELQSIGLALGGNAGAKRSTQRHLPTSATTLLRLIRATPTPDSGTPVAVGIDEWAWRRGHHYGTLIVDLETHRVLDLLPDRKAETVAAWLKQHPSVQVVCRDRYAAFADAANQGAPQAQQVADRYHLVQNLGDALLPVLQQHKAALQAAAEATARQQVGEAIALDTREDAMARGNQQRRSQQGQQEQARISQQRLERRRAHYDQVQTLHAQGEPVAEIARQLGISRQTVYRYLHQEQPPGPRVHQRRRQDRVLAPYEAYLRQRWRDGCHNSSRLYREIRDQGYPGSRRTVTRFINELRQDAQEGAAVGREQSPFTRRRGPAARDVLATLLRPAKQRSTLETQYLEHLQAAATDLTASFGLIQAFLTMVRERTGVQLPDWLKQVAKEGCDALQRFANGLCDDLAAVQAGLTEQWSNGVTEGHVNRLKLLKRHAYGRSGFATLRARVLHS
jgi:transposase